MRHLEEIAEALLSISPVSFNSSIHEEVIGDIDRRLSGWLFNCHGLWYNVSLVFPAFVFVAYLGYQAKKSFTKLSNGRSYIMISYYGLLWLVSLLNLAWCTLQVCDFFFNLLFS